jgi:hypothetical protein
MRWYFDDRCDYQDYVGYLKLKIQVNEGAYIESTQLWLNGLTNSKDFPSRPQQDLFCL